METVEGQNPIEVLKLVDDGELDRISSLPDCLLVEVLSRLPSTEDAIRTSTLSKRWKHVWTSVTTLRFIHTDYPYTLSDFVSFVDKTLTQRRRPKLKKLLVCTDYDIQFDSQFNNWIRYAISCNVEELEFGFWLAEEPEFLLDQFFFICSCFIDVTLARFILNPTGPISWKNLTSLCLFHVKTDEDLIENILSGSPQLQTLDLSDCYGYRRLDIASKCLKNLVFSGYHDPNDHFYNDIIIEINAPNISSLTIKGYLSLWKLLLVNVSSLVEAKLDYVKLGPYKTTYKEEAEEAREMLKQLILSLSHVNELKICSTALSRLEAKGFVFPSNMKYPTVITCNWPDFDSDSDC